MIINNLKNDFICCLLLHALQGLLQQNYCIIILWDRLFFSTLKSFSMFFSSISSENNVSTIFFSRCVYVLSTSCVIIKIKFIIIIIMFFKLFCKMNKQISSFAFFSSSKHLDDSSIELIFSKQYFILKLYLTKTRIYRN